ncbi:hypothetical protein [Mesorhizobium sp. B1-1-7]|uniref:hypothetical protein n=1 Tax=Mesorhizobium sp. B1-1-7 TaxID=2589977 RepID=UPI00112E73F9|nr:hypothetical protein [Mesorhizobium sp. B1-1-7]TPN53881.1 hypothetical protein FJ978_07165 [Mesorhizobium sp. B1-1-7]
MTETTPVERVARMLEEAKFLRIKSPLQIGGLKFEAPAAFVGQSPSPDLVIVGDSAMQTARDLQTIIEGIGRALDVVRSRRPLTLVLVGPRLESSALAQLCRYARVLPVGETADDASLNNWLAVLLPLKLPKPVEARGIDCLEELRTSASTEAVELIDLATSGAQAVADRYIGMVEEPFEEDHESNGSQA